MEECVIDNCGATPPPPLGPCLVCVSDNESNGSRIKSHSNRSASFNFDECPASPFVHLSLVPLCLLHRSFPSTLVRSWSPSASALKSSALVKISTYSRALFLNDRTRSLIYLIVVQSNLASCGYFVRFDSDFREVERIFIFLLSKLISLLDSFHFLLVSAFLLPITFGSLLKSLLPTRKEYS